MLRHSHEKTTFLAPNRSWSQVCEIQYWPPSSLPFKVVPPSFEYGLVLLATLIRGGGGSQAQDHRQAIYAKIRYSVSSTFATSCSLFQALRYIVEMTRNWKALENMSAWSGKRCAILPLPSFLPFYFRVRAFSFRGPYCLGAWNRLDATQLIPQNSQRQILKH